MRIVCPNCGAQYEVDAALIPAPGRDVQCSNCGRGWFQAHSVEAEAAADGGVAPEATVEPAAEPAPEPAAEPAPEPVAEPVAEVRADPAPEPDMATARASAESSDEGGYGAEPELVDERTLQGAEIPVEPEPDTIESEISRMIRSEREPEPEPAPAETPEDATEPGAVPGVAEAPEREDRAPASEPGPEVSPPPPEAGTGEADTERSTRPLVDLSATPANPAAARHDPETLAVLREEAERELRERRREGGALETQPDLGLDSAPPERPTTQPARAAEEVAARKDLLPDIDEINSSLSPETTVAIANSLSGHEDTEATDRRRGFRLGFGTMVLAAALLIALYLAAPWLARTVPGAETFLVSYVDWANGVRDWIDGLLAAGVDRFS